MIPSQMNRGPPDGDDHDEGVLEDVEVERLLRAAEMIGRKDPMGYLASIASVRNEMDDRARRSVLGRGEVEGFHEAIEAIGTWSAFLQCQ